MPEIFTTDFGSGSNIMQRLLLQREAEKARAATWAEAQQYTPTSLDVLIEQQTADKLKWQQAASDAKKATDASILSVEEQQAKDRQIRANYEQMAQRQAEYQEQQLEEIRQQQSRQNPNNARPSSASAPATPRTSGSGLGMNMKDSPATGSPRTAAAPVDVMERPPVGLPAPAAEINAVQSLARNAGAGAAVAGIGDFGAQLVAGRPVGDAAGHAAFTAGGSGIGTVLGATAGGAVLGPVGAYVGGAVGGFVGGGLGGYLYDQLFPRPAQPPASSTYEASPPFTGGQGIGVSYKINMEAGYHEGDPPRFKIDRFPQYFNGPIIGVKTTKELQGNNGTDFSYRYTFVLQVGNPVTDVPQYNTNWGSYEISRGIPEPYVRILSVSRTDGQPDTDGNLPSPPLIIENRTYTQINNQTTYVTPRAEPAAGQTPAPAAYAPSNLTTKENGTSRGDSPDWVPHGGLTGDPHPDTTPLLISPLPYNAPGTTPQSTAMPPPATQLNPLGGTVESNSDGSVTFTTSGKLQDSAQQQATNSESLQPNPSTSGNYTTSSTQPLPSTLPQTTASKPEPDATRKIPASQPESQQSTQTNTNTVTKDDFESFKKDLEKLIAGGTILAGLTPAIQTIGDKVNQTFQQTTPEAVTEASKQGCCDAFAPNGCNGDIRENAQKAAQKAEDNNSILKAIRDLLNLTLNGFNSALLEQVFVTTRTINSKLGEAVPGGISGFMTRGFKMLRLGTIINWLTFIGVMHNALMLTSAMKDTLLAMMTSISQLAGFKDEHDQPLNFNEMFNSGIETLVKSIVGEDNYTELKKDWVKANRIYQATANMLSAVQSMMSGLQQGVELVGNYVALIGNGIKAAGTVSEKAYKWMSEKMHLERTSKFLQLEKFESSVQKATDTISNFDMIAQSGVQLKDSYKQFTDAKDEFKKELNGEEEKKAKAEKEAKAKAKDPGYNAEALNSAKE